MPEYVDVIRSAFIDLWAQVVLFLPMFLFAVVVFLLGLIVAQVLKSLVERIVKMLKIDELMQKLEVTDLFAKMGLKLDVGAVLGWIVKWFVIIFALIASADVLEWNQVTIFLSQVITYIPNVMIAIIILLVGVLLANFVQGVIMSAVKAAQLHSVSFLAGIAKWSIVVFSFMAALVQLGIAQGLIQTLFTGFVAMLALAGGLAFGLGGREQASRILEHIRQDLTKR
ncbi:MAG: hypothetical protein ABH826_01500 [Patescibacteria group bacterium]|nr:hypothetical protein [Patescibacteria group bacterium]